MVSGASLESLEFFLQQAHHRYARQMGAFLSRVPSDAQISMDRRNDDTDLMPARFAFASLSPAVESAWQRAALVFKEGQIVHAIVTGWNRGGLLVRWDELQGFVPASQLRDIPVFVDDASRDEKLAHWVGEELQIKVIELDRGRNRLVFSERATLWGPKDGDRLLSEIIPGHVRRGRVSNLCDFGVFVDLGGVDGLIHVSELSWGRVAHPREILEIGQEVEVYVISIDHANRRVALSLKRLQPDPWTVAQERYFVGQVLDVTITNVVDFGAFARVEEGLEGLVHASEIGEGSGAHPAEVLQPGERVRVRILRIDSANHRLALSMRQVQSSDWADTHISVCAVCRELIGSIP